MNTATAELTFTIIGDALIAGLIGLFWTFARQLIKLVDQRLEARQKSARKPGDPTS
jgi:hypothetical protein